jgi:predicted PurR-regulated permease PerM
MPAFTLVLFILLSAVIGGGSAFYFNKLIQLSHKTTYSLEEEIDLYDQTIDKVNKNEVKASDLVRVFESEKKRRIAAHDVMNSSQEISRDVIVVLILLSVVQILLVFLYAKKNDGA